MRLGGAKVISDYLHNADERIRKRSALTLLGGCRSKAKADKS
jgi:hypothetical protein